MARIENISDQLGPFSQEVAGIVRQLILDNYLATDQAIKVVEIAVIDMMVDVLHHIAEEGLTIHTEE